MMPVSRISWKPSWRIIPSRFPPIQLFERVADPADLDAVMDLEGLTNPRLRDEVGDIQLVPKDERVSGPGSSVIMAAFTHLNPDGSRFTDGSYGVFYSAKDFDTAIAETKFHREAFMRATDEPRMELDMRVYLVDVEGQLHDIRERQADLPLAYHASNYGGSQKLATELRDAGSNGIVYSSVRYDGGECVAAFRTTVLTNARQERHLCYIWDGKAISTVYEKRIVSSD
ncbi:MAG: hypothetical protein CTR53_11675 [Ferrovibrio sp.]|nr:MAG: hypothetical protein CTR53_11675 [Ferrovibrio sp.]